MPLILSPSGRSAQISSRASGPGLRLARAMALACVMLPILAWTSSEEAALLRGEILVEVDALPKPGPGGRVRAGVDIPVGAKALWDLMLDCANAPNYVPKMTHCAVIERSVDSSSDLREQRVRFLPGLNDLKLRFRSYYTPLHEIRFVKDGGDLAILEGSWRIQSLSPNASRLHYQADMATKTPFPAGLVRSGMRRDTQAILHAVREEAIRRAAALSPPASESASP